MIRYLKLLMQKRHRFALRNFFFTFDAPGKWFIRYFRKTGVYPDDLVIKVGGNRCIVRLYSSHDLDTANQVFCRRDYPVSESDEVFVDFGANIGFATLLFCLVSQTGVAYSFEPSKPNMPRLVRNLKSVAERVRLFEYAVSDFDGESTFASEGTGRYGRLDSLGSSTVTVVNAKRIISEILEKHGRISVLKVDIEGTEETVLRCLSPDQLRKIDRIFAEYQGGFVPAGFKATRYGYVTHFSKV